LSEKKEFCQIEKGKSKRTIALYCRCTIGSRTECIKGEKEGRDVDTFSGAISGKKGAKRRGRGPTRRVAGQGKKRRGGGGWGQVGEKKQKDFGPQKILGNESGRRRTIQNIVREQRKKRKDAQHLKRGRLRRD